MARSREELLKMNQMAPELAEAVKARPLPEMALDKDPREVRAGHLRTLRHMMPVPGPIPDQVTEQEHLIPVRDGHRVKVVSYKPAKAAPPGPLVVLVHEGGWCLGDLSDEEPNARLLTRDLGVTCLNVEYRLAPEHVFPTGINDCWDVVQWAAANASSIHADPTKGFIVGGSSAGGNISAILAHLSRDNNLNPPITGQWLSVPYVIPSIRVPPKYQAEYISPMENDIDPVLKAAYVDDNEDKPLHQTLKFDVDSPLFSAVASPLYPPTTTNQQGKGPLAKAFFQVAGLDPLRDHGLVYDRILREEYGVATKVNIYAGYGHMFWTNWPELPMSQQFARDMKSGFTWLLD